MNRRIAKSLSVLLLLTAIAVTQVPVSDVEAVAIASDFQMEGSKLLKYTGTAEVVSIPAGVQSIGEEAFAGNDDIIKVKIDGEVESIGYRAFAQCDNLRTITVGDNVTEIETAAFSNNKELVNVNLGAKVRNIGNGIFAGSSQLSKVSVSEDNPYLHYSNGILYDADETIVYALMPAYEKGAFTVPSTVTEIKGYAFWGNPYLEKVTLCSSLSEVPAYAFSNCLNLKEVNIPLTVRGIGAKAFEDCVNLSSVTLPDSMARISDTAFDGCPNVEFTATPGTYGAEFAAARKTSEVEEVEYEDVQDSQVIDPDSVSGDESVEGSQEEGTEGSAEPTPTPKSLSDTISNKTLLGESSIVSGRAVIFINNSQPTVLSGNQKPSAGTGQIDLSVLDVEEIDAASGSDTGIENLLYDNAQKGKDFPKFSIVDNTKIASQAFYQDSDMTEYTIEEGITEIGEFAFARSNLTSVVIPQGVTRIGYGAFYHCDDLKEVVIPDSVTEIESYAFDKTPWIEELQPDSPFKVVGDGILIAYTGSDSVVNIPTTVNQIGQGVFREHMGIIAVNIPDTVQIIGEEAFMDCKNLKTVNGGNNLVKVADRAFMNCPLSQVVIPASMEEVGLGAYALAGGTDTVVFMGSEPPVLTMGWGAKRLANQTYRTYAFGNIKNAIVPDSAGNFEGTVLENGAYGFHGVIYNESGNMVSDNQAGVDLGENSGIAVQVSSEILPESENAMVTIPGDGSAYVFKVQDSQDAAQRISAAYGELYGGKAPFALSAYEMSLYDRSGTIPITRLGKQYATVLLKLPQGMPTDSLHMVTLDQDGQLEAVEYRIVTMEDGNYIQFNASHFSPFGIYRNASVDGQAVVTDGSAVITSLSNQKDDTPDTGDFIHPKWFLAIGLLAGAVALFFYKGKSKRII